VHAQNLAGHGVGDELHRTAGVMPDERPGDRRMRLGRAGFVGDPVSCWGVKKSG
jgi:hypothetical protein